MSIQTKAIEESDRTEDNPKISVLSFKGPLFFGATNIFDDVMSYKFKEETKMCIKYAFFYQLLILQPQNYCINLLKNLKNLDI